MLVIVTIGMFLAINSIAQVQFGNDIKLLPRAYPNKTWLPGNVQISSDTLVLVGVLLAECLILYLVLNRTRIGLAFRAVASNPESSRLVGVPVGRMLMLGWAMAAAIGALAGALVIAPVGLQGASMQEILVYSFAAAALGGFDSPVGAVVAGLIVGVAGTMTTQYLHVVHDIELVVPFGLILVVLLFRPAGPVRLDPGGARVTLDRERIIRLVVAIAFLIGAAYLFGWYIPQFYESSTTYLWAEAFYIGVAAMGLNLLTGYNGQVSIGHGAFFGLGMYTTAILMESHDWPFLPTLLVAAAIAFGVGVLVGFPALRVKGLYLALVTLGLAVLFPQLTNRFVPHDLCKTCGTSQVGELARVKLLPPSWTPTFIHHPDQWAYYATLTIAVVGIVALFLIVRSRFGRALIAVRDHEAAAETGRHQHRAGQGHRVRDERPLRGRGGLVLRARQPARERVVGVDLPALDRVPRRGRDRRHGDRARSRSSAASSSCSAAVGSVSRSRASSCSGTSTTRSRTCCRPRSSVSG